MGIATIVTAALKHVSWGQVADAALHYGPDLIRKLKRRQHEPPVAEDEPAAAHLSERIQELENALVRQDEVISRQNARIESLEEIGKTLQARLNIVIAVSAVWGLALLAVIVLR